MSALNDLPEEVLTHARQAFVLVLAQHEVKVPMYEIVAETIVDRNGKHARVLWRQGPSRRTSAQGSFYPSTCGGSIRLDFLQPSTKEIQPKAEKYDFNVTEDSCLQLTVAP